MKSFASDNYSGIDPQILKAIESANHNHAIAYGDDEYSQQAIKKFKEHFGNNIEVFFVCTGTAANVLGLQAVTKSFNSVICAQSAHLNVDECGSPEKFIGCKLIQIPTKDGKLTVDHIKPHLASLGNPHRNQLKVISITQSTEYGTLYSIDEIKNLTAYAHEHNLLVHMDGARLSNAAASLNTPFKAFTADAGIDLLSFGGTKNGLMFAESVVFFNRPEAKDFPYIRKQGMQLASKMRFIAVQFETFLSNDLYLKNANHANAMAQLLAQKLEQFFFVNIKQKVAVNAVFATMPLEYILPLQKKYPFYIWNNQTNEVRLMCSFDTTEQDIQGFITELKKISK